MQIVTILLNNAARYTPEGGNIHLQMQVDDEHIGLSVHDDGIGIAPELQSRICDLFAQAERTPDRSQGGLGIGLALVNSLTGGAAVVQIGRRELALGGLRRHCDESSY